MLYLSFPFKAHSQTVSTRQPIEANSFTFFSSLARFFASFSRQNSFRLDGHLNKWQSCWCQKQPLTWITALNLGNTRSGLPGKSRLSILYRCPFRWRYPIRWVRERTSISGLVFSPRIPDIILDLVFESTMSIDQCD